MMIKSNIENILRNIKSGVKLICVSKYHPNEMILEAYEFGQRDFAESRVQELLRKHSELPSDIKWHFIGPLQTNKIKYIVSFIHLIHSVESIKQIEEINRCASKFNRKVDILLEVHIAEESQKHGFDIDEIINFFKNSIYERYPFVEFCGLMAIATLTEDKSQLQNEFKEVKNIFETIRTTYDNEKFSELSIGMSDDYPLAIEQGSTMIRIGSKIFGQRIYSTK